ncbi:MAG: hypothetical protein GQ569_12090 [Methylococcaceae bacterium]|nr:hypothetical protein [Methylococcaceae bacterium]
MLKFFSHLFLLFCSVAYADNTSQKPYDWQKYLPKKQSNTQYGLVNYDQQRHESLTIHCSAILNGTTVTKQLTVNGSLDANAVNLNELYVNGDVKAVNSILNSAEINGKTHFINSQIAKKLTVNGLLIAEGSHFASDIIVSSSKIVLSSSHIQNIIVNAINNCDNDSEEQVIHLKNNTHLYGKIVFNCAKGKVLIDASSIVDDKQIKGAVIIRN